MDQRARAALDTLFNPQSVAIIGISSEIGTPGLGGDVLRHLRANGFGGQQIPAATVALLRPWTLNPDADSLASGWRHRPPTITTDERPLLCCPKGSVSS